MRCASIPAVEEGRELSLVNCFSAGPFREALEQPAGGELPVFLQL